MGWKRVGKPDLRLKLSMWEYYKTATSSSIVPVQFFNLYSTAADWNTNKGNLSGTKSLEDITIKYNHFDTIINHHYSIFLQQN